MKGKRMREENKKIDDARLADAVSRKLLGITTCYMLATSGKNAGLARIITDIGPNGIFNLESPFPNPILTNDKYEIRELE